MVTERHRIRWGSTILKLMNYTEINYKKAFGSMTQRLFTFMAERVGFEPTYGLTHNSISSRARYGRTSLPLLWLLKNARLRRCCEKIRPSRIKIRFGPAFFLRLALAHF